VMNSENRSHHTITAPYRFTSTDDGTGRRKLVNAFTSPTCAACDLTGTYLKIEMMTFSVVWYAHVKAPRRSMGKDSNNTFPRNIFPRAVRAANRFLPAAFWKRCCGF